MFQNIRRCGSFFESACIPLQYAMLSFTVSSITIPLQITAPKLGCRSRCNSFIFFPPLPRRPFISIVTQTRYGKPTLSIASSENAPVIATSVSDSTDCSCVSDDDWKNDLQSGSIIEVWAKNGLKYAQVVSLYEQGVVALLAQPSEPIDMIASPVKISFGEIISVWPSHFVSSSESSFNLIDVISHGLVLLQKSGPRSLDASLVYGMMRKFPKNDKRGILTSFQISEILFPLGPDETLKRRASFAVASGLVIASDTIRFKRASPGRGWRALPPSVTVSRGRCSFVEICSDIINIRRAPAEKGLHTNSSAPVVWSRDHLDILRDLEIVAASGSVASGTVATTLLQLGYAPNDDGAATLLLDLNYWSTGPPKQSSTASNLQRKDQTSSANEVQTHSTKDVSLTPEIKQDPTMQEGETREWTFSPEILAEARDIRSSARVRKLSYLTETSARHGKRRRSLLHPPDGHSVPRVYCIDEKSSRFLDDAMSVQLMEDGTVIRLGLHIADVDEIIKSGSALDEFAKERGQSLYLPLKPLHMLPAAAMDAASFNTSLPTEAITVMVDFDINDEVVRNWEVFPSIVPPVRKVNYEQFDIAMEQGAKVAQVSDEDLEDLKWISYVAPLLADKLDFRKATRRMRVSRSGDNRTQSGKDDEGTGEFFADRAVASVKLIKRWDRNRSKNSRVAEVVGFRATGSHQTVNNVLTCAGGLIRKFARENRAYLPEDRFAYLHSSRCGTAPLRRYCDLAVQRQIKCILYGRQPAGKRRMDELKIWLTKRQAVAERTLAERRRSALFESFSNFCSQKCAVVGSKNAIVRGIVRGVCVTKRSVLKVDVSLIGTGLSTTASVSDAIFAAICNESGRVAGRGLKGEALLEAAQKAMRTNTEVQVEILEVNIKTYSIQACIVEVLGKL